MIEETIPATETQKEKEGETKEKGIDFKLNKLQRLVTNSTERDDARPVLACVHIRKGIIEVANGFVLVQKAIEYDGNELLLKAKDIEKLKDSSTLEGVIFTKTEADRGLRVLGQIETILELQQGNFPQTDKLYPITEPVFKIALAREQLLTVLKSLDKTENIIRFTFYGKSDPVKFDIQETGTKGLIMPMYVDWEENSKENKER